MRNEPPGCAAATLEWPCGSHEVNSMSDQPFDLPFVPSPLWSGIGRPVPNEVTAKLLRALSEIDAAKDTLRKSDVMRKSSD
jgi:hypothetical protein